MAHEAHEAHAVISHSAEETRDLGRMFAKGLLAGDVLLLVGDLGAGKTTFVKGIGDTCRIATTVRSPTFARMHRYRGHPDLVHIDLYRGSEGAVIEDLALDEQDAPAVTVVEWPGALAASLWPEAPRVLLEHLDEHRRRILLPPLPHPPVKSEPDPASPRSRT